MFKKIFGLKGYEYISAIVSAVLVAVIGYILSVGDVFHLDWKQLLNMSIMTALASLLKVLMTNDNGKFVGAIKVKQGK